MNKLNEEIVMSRRNPSHGLAPLKRVLAAHGNPQDQIRVIHIAGTNGKGSTCNYLKDILTAEGYRTGLFTSPHLITHRDRIRINDRYIPSDVFQSYLDMYEDEILENELGMFEIDTLIAYSWFADEQVDYAVMECGLGGRLDNTNVIEHPELEIITTIGKDHTAILGERSQQIAFEKAGIIMPGSHVITGRMKKAVREVIQRKAVRNHSACTQVKPIAVIGECSFRYRDDTYEVSTSAGYQKENAALALEAARYLGMPIHSPAVHEAVKKSQWAGRFETMCTHPHIIIDGAHNEEGILALCRSMRTLSGPVITVFSALKDKPGRQMALCLQEVSDVLIITQFENQRADTLDDLYIEHAQIEEDYHKAVQKAVELCGAEGTVVITGSLYFISLIRAYLQENIHS